MEDFRQKVLFFVAIGNNIVVQKNMNDARSSKDWMEQELNLDEDAYGYVTRGYMMPGRIQFYTGGECCTPEVDLHTEVINDALIQYLKLFPDVAGLPLIGNGCHIGEVGEIWKPVLYWTGRWEVAEDA